MTSITFTGANDTFTRNQLSDMARHLGYDVRSSVCSKTPAVVGDYATIRYGLSSKARRAAEKGLGLVSYAEFVGLFERSLKLDPAWEDSFRGTLFAKH